QVVIQRPMPVDPFFEEFFRDFFDSRPRRSNILGELIGINTAIYGNAQGIGFAIPVDRVRRSLASLVSGRPQSEAAPNQLAWAQPGIRVRGADRGPAAARVRDGSAADRVGVQRGDRLLGFDGDALDSLDTLGDRLRAAHGAPSVVLSIGRGPYRYDVEL